MYKRLYDEEHKLHSSHAQSVDAAPGIFLSFACMMKNFFAFSFAPFFF